MCDFLTIIKNIVYGINKQLVFFTMTPIGSSFCVKNSIINTKCHTRYL